MKKEINIYCKFRLLPEILIFDSLFLKLELKNDESLSLTL